MKSRFFIGIDTSNYTTSAAAVSAAGEVFFAKRLLEVPEKSLGLRQSDALFSHTRALPEITGELARKLSEHAPDHEICAFGASSRPRRIEGSYMPCFLAGVSAAKSAAAFAQKPLYLFSHQEGHIESARQGCRALGRPFPDGKEFFALHLSGGTGEILHVQEDAEGYRAGILASTLDITFGQLLDRCGVALALPFPAGAGLEKLALQSKKDFRVKVAKSEKGVSLSGFENRFRRLLASGEAKEDAAKFAFCAVLQGIRELLSFIPEEKRGLPVLFSGGVISSSFLKDHLQSPRHFFAPPEYSADNAIGTAYLARRLWEANNEP